VVVESELSAVLVGLLDSAFATFLNESMYDARIRGFLGVLFNPVVSSMLHLHTGTFPTQRVIASRYGRRAKVEARVTDVLALYKSPHSPTKKKKQKKNHVEEMKEEKKGPVGAVKQLVWRLISYLYGRPRLLSHVCVYASVAWSAVPACGELYAAEMGELVAATLDREDKMLEFRFNPSYDELCGAVNALRGRERVLLNKQGHIHSVPEHIPPTTFYRHQTAHLCKILPPARAFDESLVPDAAVVKRVIEFTHARYTVLSMVETSIARIRAAMEGHDGRSGEECCPRERAWLGAVTIRTMEHLSGLFVNDGKRSIGDYEDSEMYFARSYVLQLMCVCVTGLPYAAYMGYSGMELYNKYLRTALWAMFDGVLRTSVHRHLLEVVMTHIVLAFPVSLVDDVISRLSCQGVRHTLEASLVALAGAAYTKLAVDEQATYAEDVLCALLQLMGHNYGQTRTMAQYYMVECLSIVPCVARLYGGTTFKIVDEAVWRESVNAGEAFKGVGIDLDDGFIHLSMAPQCMGTLNRFFKGVSGLLLVEVDMNHASVRGDLKMETNPHGTYPHLYCELAFDAVVGTSKLLWNETKSCFDVPDVLQRWDSAHGLLFRTLHYIATNEDMRDLRRKQRAYLDKYDYVNESRVERIFTDAYEHNEYLPVPLLAEMGAMVSDAFGAMHVSGDFPELSLKYAGDEKKTSHVTASPVGGCTAAYEGKGGAGGGDSDVNFQEKIDVGETMLAHAFSFAENEEEEGAKRVWELGDRLGTRQPMIVCASLVDKIPNLGGLTRTCEIFNLQQLVINQLESTKRNREYQKVSLSGEKWLPMAECSDDVASVAAFLIRKRAEGYAVVALEQTAQSETMEQFQFPEKVVLLLGKELEGVPVELLQLVDYCVEIPQFGLLRSLNVHVSASLLIWAYTAQRLVNNNTTE
jgi:tRNA G18 (ribose-2'-O)-methylase SpoU/uncharacterized protein (DUF952 family)